MRRHPNELIEKFRLTHVPASAECRGTNAGAFLVKYGNIELRVIADDGGGWDHVSVSLPHRIPFWSEMAFVKALFWGDDEVVMQLHVGKADHINTHNNCLHLWRPQTPDERARLAKEFGELLPHWPTATAIPLPPKEMV